jgi:hypothetical protein
MPTLIVSAARQARLLASIAMPVAKDKRFRFIITFVFRLVVMFLF